MAKILRQGWMEISSQPGQLHAHEVDKFAIRWAVIRPDVGVSCTVFLAVDVGGPDEETHVEQAGK